MGGVPFAVSKLVIALVSPLGTALALALLGLLLLARSRRLASWLLVLAFAWLWLWSTPAVSDALQKHLDDRFPPLPVASLPRADAIVLLGGALAPPTVGRPYPDLGIASDRIWHAARVFRAGKAPLLVVSGGSDPAMGPVPEAEAMAGLLADLGVPSSAMLLEAKSRTTRENADMTAAVLRPRNVRTILLVTSATHMPRSIAEFRRVGFEVIPAATDHAMPRWRGALQWVPETGALETSARCIKEVVGGWVAARP